ncbi:hypothetical protein [Pragia fontium]|uniref:hypothetical protein n=1 Tax=Pragia fontium TaxID=82985 RepID=UPI000649B905|nr:hypothetical protein [Pragia fontium]AKJ41805.1 hypothetical protein QQ39_06675 [Pragia fontium]
MNRFMLGTGEPPDGELEITIHELINGTYFQIVGMPLSRALKKVAAGEFDAYGMIAEKIKQIGACVLAA